MKKFAISVILYISPILVAIIAATILLVLEHWARVSGAMPELDVPSEVIEIVAMTIGLAPAIVISNRRKSRKAEAS